ncbi:1876_t:CDS:10 [Funneliformis caledonium]|uniref:1876_t:CDS:1 n=1 Tax=Funneliformis caledonium TaxID=1117310 RepID=A0A9N8ZEJ8_9GLOM|nr:1876_t:CDS:10 [Funneliformis caledonium]
MSLSVNFNVHSKALLSSYQAVLNGDKDTEWVVYGYDKGGNDLKVLEKGAGGLEELVEEFNDGRIQYAFVRVIDPNTELPKFVLIGWVRVPEIKKGLFNSHFNEVSKFLKGYHLQINARSEADVDPDYIMKRISESGGSKYSINVNKERARKEEPILPVNSVYERVKIPDITAQRQSSSREQIKPVSSVYQPVQLPKPKPLGKFSTWTERAENSTPSGPSPAELKARRERERAEKEERERIESEEKARKDREEKARQLREEKEKKERQEKERKMFEEEERKGSEEKERKRTEKEEREKIEREERERLEAERLETELKKLEIEEAERREQDEREEMDRIEHEKELQRQRETEEREERQRLEYEREQEQQEAERLLLEQEQQIAEVSAESAGGMTAVVQFSYDAAEDNEIPLREGEIIRDIVPLDEGWWQGVGEDGRTGLFPANYVEIVESVASEQPIEETQEVEAELVQQTVDSSQGNYIAKALFDYGAGEENEISFQDGAIITDIEFVSDDWWQGKAPDGKVGLFPELQETPVPLNPISEQVLPQSSMSVTSVVSQVSTEVQPNQLTRQVQNNKARCFKCRAKIPLAKQTINKCRCGDYYFDRYLFVILILFEVWLIDNLINKNIFTSVSFFDP